MSLRTLICIVLVSLSASVMAFEDDYIWQDKFNKQLPKAEQGDIKAQYDIGSMYERGKGVLMNHSTAFQWYAKAAQQGHSKAAFKVGFSFLRGKGVGKNLEKALKWFKIAATKNNVRSYYFLGTMYEKGSGIPKNLNTSLSWYKKALKGGYGLAQERINAINSKLKTNNRLSAKKEPVAQANTTTADNVETTPAATPDTVTSTEETDASSAAN